MFGRLLVYGQCPVRRFPSLGTLPILDRIHLCGCRVGDVVFNDPLKG